MGHGEQRITKRQRKATGRGVRTAREGIYAKRKWFKEYMREIGFEWTPCMKIGSGCQVHLAEGELTDGTPRRPRQQAQPHYYGFRRPKAGDPGPELLVQRFRLS